ncbi:MAG: extracellular solute-binding protein [Lachnospiraceae bacterium]|nr:extracellular solute-binding protein [Lachnospiraceae bacterium]
MKKNTLQKVLSVSLIGTMAITMLAGCGSEQSAQTEANTTEAATEKTTEAEPIKEVEEVEVKEEAGMASWTKFDQTVTLQVPVYDRGGEVDVTNNYWTKWIQENFGDTYNINVEYVAIPRGDVLNAYANLANSGSLPTILMEYDFPKQAQWADDGYLQELDLDQLAQIAPTYYQMIVDQGNLQNTALNGTTYFALAERPYWNNTYNYATFYRADWLEQLGLEYPQTFADRVNVYKAIKDAGLCDYPAGGSKIAGAGVDQNYGFRTYPQDEYTWATTGDYAIPALSTEAQKKLIKRENQLFNDGYLNPEFYTRETTDNEADFIAGKCFEYRAYIAPSIAVLDSFYEQNSDAKLAIAVCPGLVVDDEGVSNSYRPNNGFGMMVSFSATAKPEEVKAGMMYMEWLMQPENLFTFQYGFEGETFDYVDGLPTMRDLTGTEYAMANNNKDYFCIVVESKTLGEIEKDVKLNAPVNYPDSDDFYTQLLQNYSGMVAMADSGYVNSDCNFAVAITAVTDYQQVLLDKYSEYRTKLTTCSPDEFDSLYEQYSQEYLDAGYQAVIDERGEAYKNGYTSKLPEK